jgi:trehalose 6-phosphate phosphatase
LNILAERHLSTLADFACSSVLLGFDYDGTLAPISSQPSSARMRATTRRLLGRVARCYPCIVISGRANDDLTKRLGRLPLWHVIGNHGLEPSAETSASALQVHQWAAHLRDRLAAHAGVVVEDKTLSVTIHYRHARNKSRVRRAIAMALRGLPNARAMDGKQAVSLIPRDGPDKGVALQRARRVLACETAIYVGDDGTDEDAFASAPRSQLLAIRVGATSGTRAPYHVRSQVEIDRLLQILLALRRGAKSRYDKII